MKICIIEDNRSISKLFSKHLTANGYETTVCNGGREGLVQLHKEKFDLTLLDIAMPEFSGIDILDALHNSGRIKDQKILVITASLSTMKELDNQIRDHDIEEVLIKPISLPNLLAKVEEYTKN